jgi:hypothetical protein
MRCLVGVVAIMLWAVPVSGSSSESPPSLFPDGVAGWRVAERSTYDRSNLFDFIDGGAEVYLAYDFRRAWVQMYRSEGEPEIGAETYDMGSPEEAYGVLSIDLTGEKVEVGSPARYGAGLLRFCKGRWFVRVLAERETPETQEAVLALGAQIAKGIPEESRLPDLLSVLPAEGLVPDSTTYFHTQVTLGQIYYLSHENLLSLGPDTDAVIADYRAGSEEAKLLVVQYPTVERRTAAHASFLEAYLGASAGEKKRVVQRTEDGRFVGVDAAAQHVLLVLDAPDADAARELLDEAIEKISGGTWDD